MAPKSATPGLDHWDLVRDAGCARSSATFSVCFVRHARP